MRTIRLLRPAGRAAPRLDAETVDYRLSEAGRSVLALGKDAPMVAALAGTVPELRLLVAQFFEVNGLRCWRGTVNAELRERAVEAYGWLGHIPRPLAAARRAVTARSLVSPVTGRPLYDWNRLGVLLACPATEARAAHVLGLGIIVGARQQRLDDEG